MMRHRVDAVGKTTEVETCDVKAPTCGCSANGQVWTTDSSGNLEIMAVVTPGKKCRMTCDILCFIVCITIMIIQMGVLDFYFINHLKASYWYAWIAGDVLLLGVMIWLLAVAIKYNQRCMEEACNDDANIKYAFIGWFVYSMLLAAKVAVTFCLYYDEIATNDLFGRNVFKLTLALSALVFLFLVEAHHYTQLNSPRQLYLSYLESAITLDLLDSIVFLNLLWAAKQHNWAIDQVVWILILVFACLNFVLPTFALLKLRYNRMPGWLILPYEKMYALFYVGLVNIPYLAIRIYLYIVLVQPERFEFNLIESALTNRTVVDATYKTGQQADYDLNIFVFKNVIMIYIAMKEVYTRVQYFRQKRSHLRGGELIKAEEHGPEPPMHQG